jgi:PAS domain S-box-containing protein
MIYKLPVDDHPEFRPPVEAELVGAQGGITMDRIYIKDLLLQLIPIDLEPEPGDDADVQRRARNVLIIALSLMAVCLAMLMSVLLRAPSSHVIAILLGGAMISGSISLLAAWGQVRLATLLLVLVPLPALVIAVADTGQLNSAPYFCTVSLMIAGMTMRPRGVGLTFICVLATLAALDAASANVVQVLPPAGSQLINATILTNIVALIAALGSSSAAHSLRTLQAREREARRVEQALRESEERYRLIADNTTDLIALLDVDARYLYASPSYTRELGRSPAELAGFSRWELIHPDDLPAALAHWQQARACGSAQSSYRTAHADGTWRWLEVRLTTATRQDEQYVVLVARDITKRRVLEAQFQQAQKLEAVGRLASGVAHDFNNLLVVMSGGAELTAAALPPDHPAQADLDTIRYASRRAVGLTRQLLAFARHQPATPRLVDPGDVVRDVGRMLERLIGDDVALVMQIANDVWPVWADPGQIEQVLMNLAVNARDAMPEGGTLTIAIENTWRTPVESAVINARPIPYIRLTIADTGFGMSDEVLSHLFEPFYTTKAPDKGTGLGLALCYGIVTQIGGEIAASSAVGVGTTFTIMLPRAVDLSATDAPSHELAGPLGGGETVLVVEDDPLVRDLIARVARAHNYDVLGAADADTALALARQHADAIRVVVVDMGLPHMNGALLAAEVRRIAPHVQALLISGYIEYIPSTQDQLTTDAAFLPKPFSPAQLAVKLHELLNSPLQQRTHSASN